MASATISAEVLNSATPLRENGQLVGYILLGPNREDDGSLGRHPLPLPPEAAFLQRVAWAATWSAGIAVAIALLLGSLLARNLTQPIRALTAATRAMASGNLDQRVVVRSRDELGELGESFNQMSTDLARASQLRTQMTADLAHDIRTPLSILRGYTEGLKDGRIQGNTSIYALMHAEVEHLQRLVEDLRVLSLADAGELPLNRRLVDPLALLERTGLAYVMQAEQHGVTLRIDPPEYDLPSVDVDTDRMAQVLNNLVSNALRYTPTGEIVLRAVVDDRQVCLSISDTGIGIASVDLPFVFDRFYRADKARRRGEGASGLGLAIAKAIVEAHGGTITADSTLGQGSTFTIRMVPASQHSSPT
jgi:two-component system sensor histidine kinase BaeS